MRNVTFEQIENYIKEVPEIMNAGNNLFDLKKESV